MRKPAQAALVAALLILDACSSGTLPDYNILGALRVLALKADTPEVDPTGGPTVTITPVVSDLNQGRTLTYSAVGCIDPGVGFGASPSCTGVPGAVTLATNLAIPALDPGKNTSTGPAPVIAVPIPATILANRNPVDQFNGVAYLVVYTLIAANTDGTTTQVVSFKRIIASAATKPTKNTNPSITDLNAGSQLLTAYFATLTYPIPSGTTVALSPILTAASTETYQQQSGSPASPTTSTITEDLITTWFVSDGTTQFFRTNAMDADVWTPPGTQPAGPGGTPRSIVIVAVTRDGHGGEDFKQVDF